LLPEQDHRGHGWLPHDQRWDEEPAALVEALRAQMAVERNPQATLAHLAKEREHAVAQARTALSGRGSGAPARRFEVRLAAAQQAIVVQEDHSWWIDSRASHRLRRVVLEIGRRLVESGGLEAPVDVLHISIDELRQAMSPGTRFGTDGLVRRRKAAMECFAKMTPPATLGSAPETELRNYRGFPIADLTDPAIPPPWVRESPSVEGGGGDSDQARVVHYIRRESVDSG
jgi:hypothetical protein